MKKSSLLSVVFLAMLYAFLPQSAIGFYQRDWKRRYRHRWQALYYAGHQPRQLADARRLYVQVQ